MRSVVMLAVERVSTQVVNRCVASHDASGGIEY